MGCVSSKQSESNSQQTPPLEGSWRAGSTGGSTASALHAVHTAFRTERLGFYSNHGSKPTAGKAQRINQDCAQISYPLAHDSRLMLLGVYDGHGRQGELVSEFASNAMVEELESDRPSLSLSPARALKHSLFKVDERLALQHPDLAFNNGTTAVVAMLSATTVVVANVGDSRCVKASAGLGGWSALDLTADHKPDAPEERERIEALGGELDIDEELGVSRVIHANCALAMSRSIGDHNFNGVGVTAEADVTTHELSEGDTCLILASDGVWEFISSQQAVDLIYRHRHRGASAACAAAKRWKREEGNYRDDITAIVLFLPMQEFPTAAAALTASATAAAPAVAALKSAQGVDGGSPNTVTTVHEVGGVGARESAAEDADEFAQVDGPPSRAASEADVELRMEAFRRRRLTMDQL